MDESNAKPNIDSDNLESGKASERDTIREAIARLSFTGPPPYRPKLSWQDRLGMLGDSPIMDAIWEEGARIRAAEREQAPYYDEDELPLEDEDV